MPRPPVSKVLLQINRPHGEGSTGILIRKPENFAGSRDLQQNAVQALENRQWRNRRSGLPLQFDRMEVTHPNDDLIKIRIDNPVLKDITAFDDLRSTHFGKPYFDIPREETDRYLATLVRKSLYPDNHRIRNQGSIFEHADTVELGSALKDLDPDTPPLKVVRLFPTVQRIEDDLESLQWGVNPQSYAVRVFGQFDPRREENPELLRALIRTSHGTEGTDERGLVDIPYVSGNMAFQRLGLSRIIGEAFDMPELQKLLPRDPVVFTSTGFTNAGRRSWGDTGEAVHIDASEAAHRAGMNEY